MRSEQGANEIDMVISRVAFVRRKRILREEVKNIQACGNAHLRVILETANS